MQDNIENRLEFKQKLSNLYSLYKVKIYIFIIILFLAASSFIFLNYLEKKKKRTNCRKICSSNSSSRIK